MLISYGILQLLQIQVASAIAWLTTGLDARIQRLGVMP